VVVMGYFTRRLRPAEDCIVALPDACRIRQKPSSWLCYANLGSQSAMISTSPLLPAS
jgi:hypothetical protein